MKLGVHVGCGPIKIPSTISTKWINMDISDSHQPDIVLDCLEMENHFPENSVDYFYSCHHCEHLSYPQGVQKFFSVCYKALKKGGTLRVVVPDLMKVAKKYVAGEDLKDIYDGKFYYHFDTPAERFVYFCRAWEHTIVFDDELLIKHVREAGFSTFRNMPFGKSRIAELCNLDRFASESLVLEMDK